MKNRTVSLDIKTTPDALVDVILWSASSTDQDLRNDTWTSKSLGISKRACGESYRVASHQAVSRHSMLT